MELTSYLQVIERDDIALAVKTDGRRLTILEGGESVTGRWPLNLSRQFNKVVVFHSGNNNSVYVGDFVSYTPDTEVPDKFFIHFSNTRFSGRSIVNWTTFTNGENAGYSRKYLYGSELATPPLGKLRPVKVTQQVEVFERDENVKNWLLNKVNGKCESCGTVPFISISGKPFLEIHHVKRLADGGSDTVHNVVAICANCHRELHYGINKHQKVEDLYSKITRLIRE